MKVHNYILITGILLSSIAPVHAHNSIVPWSWSSVSSTIGSWGSSALSGISALSTEAKVATLGGIAVLTGGYFAIRSHEEKKNNFHDWITWAKKENEWGNTTLFKGYEGGSGEQKQAYKDYLWQRSNNKLSVFCKRHAQKVKEKSAANNGYEPEDLMGGDLQKFFELLRPRSNSASGIGLGKKPAVIKLDGITPGETPGGPDLVLDTRNSFACYRRVQNFLKKEMKQGIVGANWCNNLIRMTLDRISNTYGNQLDISECDADIFNPILCDIFNEVPWFKQFRQRRNRARLEQFKSNASVTTQDSIFSVLSKADAVFVDFYRENNSHLAIARIEVPEQKSAECGPWSLVNLFSMNQVVQNSSQANATSFYETSKNCFDKNFTNGPEDQQVSDDYLASKARSIGFGNYITLSVDDVLNNGRLAEVYMQILSGKIREKLKRNIPVNILLQSRSRAEVGQHSEHYSAVSIVYTGNMQEPVILLMDSLKNSAELKTKPLVESALKQIAAEVARVMNN